MNATHQPTRFIPKSGQPDKRERPVLALVSPAAQPEPRTDLRVVIGESIALFRQAHRNDSGVRIVSNVPDRFPTLAVNPQRLRRVLQMLLPISAASMPFAGELEVAVEAAPRDRAGPCIQVLIRPCGKAATMPARSTGDLLKSGLAEARSFAESFGGQIHCRHCNQDRVPEFVVLVPRD